MVKKALIYHTALSNESTPDDKDVLEEAKFVSYNLNTLGYQVEQIPFSFKEVKKDIEKIKPFFVFNLVEAINGKDSLAYLTPLMLEKLGMPYTGCPTNSFFKTETKLGAKREMKNKGIPTPYWLTLKDFERNDIPKKKFIIKSNINHASKDLEANLLEDKDLIRNALRTKGDFFAEEYIEGREFNISMVGPLGDGKVLPIPEIIFSNWPSEKPKIIDYAAKWDENSHEYNNTDRSFDFSELDKPLLKDLENICKKCWNVFNLRGYARVDFRVDKENKPYVLEINANPCISPDAGFIAAARKAGMEDEEVIKNIIVDSCGEKLFSDI
jgi:D-alanine-D-alanine ligase